MIALPLDSSMVHGTFQKTEKKIRTNGKAMANTYPH